MRGVKRERVSKRGREMGGAQFAITGATGQKVSKKVDEYPCVCVHAWEREKQKERANVCVCACVSNKGEKTTHLNVRYREAWRAGQEE